uniref:(northern house mosquito) hypothetical protein n=1 Tax=Culex pipiens TaxID=7175 RepID=A0A8D8H210_CULPI
MPNLKQNAYFKTEILQKKLQGTLSRKRAVTDSPTTALTADSTTTDSVHEVQPVIERIRCQKEADESSANPVVGNTLLFRMRLPSEKRGQLPEVKANDETVLVVYESGKCKE